MENATPHHQSIRRRILRVLLAVALATSISFAAVSVSAIWFLGNGARQQNIALGEKAVETSETTLKTEAERELQHIAQDQADLCDARLQRIQARTEAVATYATLLWRSAPDARDARPAATRHPLLYAPGVSLAAVQDDAARCAQIRAFLYWAQAADNSIEYVEITTVKGVCAHDPYRGEARTDYGLGALTPFPTSPEKLHDLPRNYDPRSPEWYKKAVTSGHPDWSAPSINALTGCMVVSYYTPVWDSNHQIVAVVSACVSLEALGTQIIGSRLEHGRGILIDEDLRIIAQGHAGADAGESDNVSLPHFSQVDTQEQARQLAAGLRAGRPGLLKEEHALLAYAPIRSTGWTVLMFNPMEAVTAPAQNTGRVLFTLRQAIHRDMARSEGEILLFSLVFFLIAAFVVLRQAAHLADRIVAPIQALDQSARILATGDLDHQVEMHTDDEIEDLADTFNQMASSLKRYTRDLAETMAAKERIQGELEMASQIQRALLPRTFPAFPNRCEFDLFAMMDPAKEVGGDFYDFFFVDDTHLFFLIGDVSDKGAPAALYMMVVKTLLKTEGLSGHSPEEALYRVNKTLAPDNDNAMFATVFCALLNTETGEMTFSNAGHNPPLLCTPDGIRYLSLPPGVPVGPMPNSRYRSASLTLAQGDMLLLYTDGVTEAKNSEGQLFGTQRLLTCVSQDVAADVTAILQQVRATLKAFAADAPQFDDITMVGLSFAGSARQSRHETLSEV